MLWVTSNNTKSQGENKFESLKTNSQQPSKKDKVPGCLRPCHYKVTWPTRTKSPSNSIQNITRSNKFSHLFYTSQVTSQWQTRVKLNRVFFEFWILKSIEFIQKLDFVEFSYFQIQRFLQQFRYLMLNLKLWTCINWWILQWKRNFRVCWLLQGVIINRLVWCLNHCLLG